MLPIHRWDGTRVLGPSSYASPSAAEEGRFRTAKPLAQSAHAERTREGHALVRSEAQSQSQGPSDGLLPGVARAPEEPKQRKKRKQEASLEEETQPPIHGQRPGADPRSGVPVSTSPEAPGGEGSATAGGETKRKTKKKRILKPQQPTAAPEDRGEGREGEAGSQGEEPEDGKGEKRKKKKKKKKKEEQEGEAAGRAPLGATHKGHTSNVGAPEAPSSSGPKPGDAQEQPGAPHATVFGSAALGWMRRPRIISSALQDPLSRAVAGPAAPVHSVHHQRTPWALAEPGSSAGGAISSTPLDSVAHLDPRLAEVLRQRLRTRALFPVQAAVWSALSPLLEAHRRHTQGLGLGPPPPASSPAPGDGRPQAGLLGLQRPQGPPLLHDLCVCAPTGSGKTLAYALPIVQSLAGRAVRRVRALIVVPTRSLAEQVKSVLDQLAPAVGLSVGLAAGLTSLAEEAAMLQGMGVPVAHFRDISSLADVPQRSGREEPSEGAREEPPETGAAPSEQRWGLPAYPTAGPGLLNAHHNASLSALNSARSMSALGSRVGSTGAAPAHYGPSAGVPRCRRESGVDILIATPGRLVEHLSSNSHERSPGAAGPLLGHKSLGGCGDCDADGSHNAPALCLHDLAFLVVDEADRLLRQSYQDWLPRTLAAAARPARPPTLTPTQAPGLPLGSLACARAQGPLARRLVKVVLSATLTRDPSKLTRLRLSAPLFLSTAPSSATRGAPAAASLGGRAAPSGAEVGAGPGTGGGAHKGGGEGPEEEGEAEAEAGAEAARYGVPQNLETHMLVCKDVSAKPPMLAWLLQSLLCPGLKRRPGDGGGGRGGEGEGGPGTVGQGEGEGEEAEDEGKLEADDGERGGGGAPAEGAPQVSQGRVLVFASSAEAAHRLALLLSGLPPHVAPFACAEYSSLQPQKRRRRALERFRRGEVQVLVSTDGMTRGMDIGELQDHNRPTPSLSHKSQSQSQGQCQGGSADGASVQDGHAGVDVVSYDAPVYPKTLLHRMGRTARAGRAGRYFTLLRKEEARHFKQLWARATSGQLRCRNMRVPHDQLEPLLPHLVTALDAVKSTVQSEA